MSRLSTAQPQVVAVRLSAATLVSRSVLAPLPLGLLAAFFVADPSFDIANSYISYYEQSKRYYEPGFDGLLALGSITGIDPGVFFKLLPILAIACLGLAVRRSVESSTNFCLGMIASLFFILGASNVIRQFLAELVFLGAVIANLGARTSILVVKGSLWGGVGTLFHWAAPMHLAFLALLVACRKRLSLLLVISTVLASVASALVLRILADNIYTSSGIPIGEYRTTAEVKGVIFAVYLLMTSALFFHKIGSYSEPVQALIRWRLLSGIAVLPFVLVPEGFSRLLFAVYGIDAATVACVIATTSVSRGVALIAVLLAIFAAFVAPSAINVLWQHV